MDSEVEIVNIRAVAVGNVNFPATPITEGGTEDAAHAIIDSDHQAYFEDCFVKTPIYDRTLLRPSNRLYGPAIITQKDSTTLVMPGYMAEVDQYMNLLIQKEE